MKLLCAIDSSQESKFVVDEVAGHPWPSGTTACVLHLIDWPRPASDASVLPAFQQLAAPIVKEAFDEIRRAGLQTSAEVLEGHPRIAAAEYAKERGVDLVLVCSHGPSELVRFLVGRLL